MSNNITWDGSTELKIDVKIDYDQIVEKTAKRCENFLHSNSPEGNRRNKKYKDGWDVKKRTRRNNESFYEVWNRTNYQLTHLLENGHIIVNKKGGVGWASAKPHIQRAVDYVRPQFIEEMGRADIDIEFEKG